MGYFEAEIIVVTLVRRSSEQAEFKEIGCSWSMLQM